LQGAGLPDPEKRLEGSGKVARHIKMKKGAATLDDASVKALIAEALVSAKVPIPAGQKRQFISSPSRQSSGLAAPALKI
jgi:hypothetical protein